MTGVCGRGKFIFSSYLSRGSVVVPASHPGVVYARNYLLTTSYVLRSFSEGGRRVVYLLLYTPVCFGGGKSHFTTCTSYSNL